MLDSLARMANAIVPMYVLMSFGFVAEKMQVMDRTAYRGEQEFISSDKVDSVYRLLLVWTTTYRTHGTHD